ncbi:MAG: RHS repeat-associated core domain-containing protein [Candidatus Binataceae bacterium]|nr:RHS repeat-associated core domain-containing protein [Candidatus Binataceae bacterium]
MPVNVVYDSDGRRTSLTVGSVTTSYGPYDADSRLPTMTFTANGNSLGQLTYTYDDDSRVIGEGGSLASLNLPASEGPNTYYGTNQILKWNGLIPANGPDQANNLIEDPTNNAMFSWDSRNQLAGISGGPASSFTGSYDAVMRRYSQMTAYGGTTPYLHDQKDVAQSSTTNAPPNPINNYLAIPGTGEVLAFTTNSGTYVPLHDRLGSTIGLVNSSNVLQTQYTYDPFGNVTTVGQASLYPYLFAGMELDSSGLYHTQSRYYSPTFGRFLSADAGMPPNAFSYVGNDPVNAIDPSGMTAEFVSGATGMSPPPDGARGVADAQPESGGLGGAVLAQGCEPIPCAPLPIQSSPESGSWLADLVSFFVGLFGGGGSQPAFIPRGYRRVAHYPAMSFITDSQADLQQFTPYLAQKSDAIQAKSAIILVQMDDEEDPNERGEMESVFFENVFNGRPTFTPSGGIILRLDNGMELLLGGNIEGKPTRNLRGNIFPYGRGSIRLMGPKPEPPWNAPNGYVVFQNSDGQAINPTTQQTVPKSESHYPLLP